MRDNAPKAEKINMINHQSTDPHISIHTSTDHLSTFPLHYDMQHVQNNVKMDRLIVILVIIDLYTYFQTPLEVLTFVDVVEYEFVEQTTTLIVKIAFGIHFESGTQLIE
jgi:hypothetical protein